METNKKKYTKPKIEVNYIKMEVDLALSSATISGGVNGSEFTPDVEEWGAEEDGGYTRGDL